MRSLWAVVASPALVVVAFAGHADAANPVAVREKIKAGALVVDVRTAAEFAAGAYEGAINIPLGEVENRLAEFGDRQRSIASPM